MPVVLIIEDTVELAEVIQATLETMGIQSLHETHGEKGLQVYQEQQPELVLLDIALPDVKGWKLLDRLKEYVQADPERPMPKVIVITAYGDPANRLMGKLQDVTHYLIKPFTTDDVKRVVASALRLRDAEPLPALPQLDHAHLANLLGIDPSELKPKSEILAAAAAREAARSTETQAKLDTAPEVATTSTTPSAADAASAESAAQAESKAEPKAEQSEQPAQKPETKTGSDSVAAEQSDPESSVATGASVGASQDKGDTATEPPQDKPAGSSPLNDSKN